MDRRSYRSYGQGSEVTLVASPVHSGSQPGKVVARGARVFYRYSFPCQGAGNVPAVLCWGIPLDRHGRRCRRLGEVVEASSGCSLLPKAEPGLFGGCPDIADSRKFEDLEPEVVRRARAGERLPEHAMLGLDAGELRSVAGKLRLPCRRGDRHSQEIS